MDIVLTDAQQMLKASARSFFQDACPKELVRQMETDDRGYPPELWRQMADLGWLAWPFPSRYGGADGNFFDLALLVEALGYAAAPTPFFSAIVLAGRLMLEAGTAAQKRELLPGIATGQTLLSLAYLEEDGDPEGASQGVTACQTANGFTLRGTKSFVPAAHAADQLLCVARTRPGRSASRGLSLFRLSPQDAAVHLRPMRTVAGSQQFDVTLSEAAIGQESLVGRLHGAGLPLQRTLLSATALKCAEMVGGAQAALDLTVDYTKQRVQFGRPIGAFQAVQHHCADMYRDLEMGRLLAYQACWLLSEGADARAAVSAAKLKLSRLYPAITQLAHQVTGGVGYYTEYPLELYTRRALAAANAFGGVDYHAARLAQTLWGKQAEGLQITHPAL
ncbi:MAG: acyl-CoA/acyl-ACP dehydrogenase [Candidatus Tectomicrobia bacterium]|nr:acyl-CoA/acyl-ACP dehydrogenase [Candidatus Tectomicrobia bacterium]